MAKEVKKTAVKDDGKTILAYNVKAKEKQKMVGATITKTERGGYIAKGKSEDGDSLTAILSKDKAEAFVKAGIAKKGWK